MLWQTEKIPRPSQESNTSNPACGFKGLDSSDVNLGSAVSTLGPMMKAQVLLPECWLTNIALQVWNLDSTSQSAVFSPYNAYGDSSSPQLGNTPAFPATEEYKTKAKDIIKKMRAGGGKSYAVMQL
jgi:hypothetical protein